MRPSNTSVGTRRFVLLILGIGLVAVLGCADKSAYNSAVTLQNSGQLEKAANAYQAFIKQFPDSKLVRKARTNMDYCESKLTYDRVAPRANELFENGRYDMAIDQLAEASKLCVKYPVFHDCQRVNQRLSTAKRHRVRQLIAEARNFQELGELENAVVRYEEAQPLAEDEESLSEIKVAVFELTQEIAEARLKDASTLPEAQKVYMGERKVTKRVVVEEERKKEELEILTGRSDPMGPQQMPPGGDERLQELYELGRQMQGMKGPTPSGEQFAHP